MGSLAQFLFDITSNLPLCGGREGVPSLSEVRHRAPCRITASQTEDGVMQSKTFVDGHSQCAKRRHQCSSHCPSCVPKRTGTRRSNTSAKRARSAPTVMVLTSGSSKVFLVVFHVDNMRQTRVRLAPRKGSGDAKPPPTSAHECASQCLPCRSW